MSRVAALTGVAALLFGVLGWGMGLEFARSLIPGWPPTRPIGLLWMILLALALAATDRPARAPLWAGCLSLAVFAMALLWLVAPPAPVHIWLASPPPAAALSFIALAIATLGLQRERPSATFVMVAALFALILPLQRMSTAPWVDPTKAVGTLGIMPLPLALLLTGLIVGSVFAHPKLPLIGRLRSRTEAARSLRIMLIVCLVGPLAITQIVLFVRSHFAIDDLDLSTIALVTISVAGTVVWWSGIENLARSDTQAEHSARRFRQLFDSAPVAHLLVDRIGLIRSANRAAAGLFGWSRRELEAMEVDALVPQSVRHGHGRLRDLFVEEGESRSMGAGRDVFGQRRGGELVPLEIALTPIEIDGEPLVLLTIVDISIRHKIEGLQDRQRAIVASSVDAIISESLDGVIQSWNASAERIFGFTADQMVGQSSLALLPDERHAEEALIQKRIAAGETIAAFETSRRRNDGSFIAVSMAVSPVMNNTGRVIGVSRIARDITDLVRLLGDLAASEARFREVTNSLPQLVWTCDPEGRCDYFSRRWSEYSGTPLANLLDGGWLDLIHPDDRAPGRARWEASMAEGAPLQVEFRLLSKKGEWRWFDTRALPLRDRDGRITKWFGSNTDIQDRRDALAALEARSRDLERSNAELEQFAYAASHDLQEPLRMITSYTQLIERRYLTDLDDKGRQMFGFVVDGAKRMQRLIGDLLAYSRLREPSAPDGRCDLADAVKGVRDLLAGGLKQADATLLVAPDLPAIAMDRAATIQLFQNLIGNALRYRSAAAPIIEIGRSGADDGFVELFVRDNGIGIDPRFHEKVFQIFQRLKRGEAGDPGGTGIGLALCRRLVQNAGGTIAVESDGHSGSTFRFTLPLAPEDDHAL
ncbi:MAG: domain S-box-containing protein [Rhizorhabdus sp.]|nr:domain S-box-containing protein [Rhizorhabdus sp.]